MHTYVVIPNLFMSFNLENYIRDIILYSNGGIYVN